VPKPQIRQPPAYALSRPLVALAVAAIRAYQAALRPLLIGSCKFCPTCSEYAIEALRRHGPWRGARLAIARILRCHPFSAGGIDPVPGAPRQQPEVHRPHA